MMGCSDVPSPNSALLSGVSLRTSKSCVIWRSLSSPRRESEQQTIGSQLESILSLVSEAGSGELRD